MLESRVNVSVGNIGSNSRREPHFLSFQLTRSAVSTDECARRSIARCRRQCVVIRQGASSLSVVMRWTVPLSITRLRGCWTCSLKEEFY